MASLSASNHVARVLSVANHVADVDASSRIANSWRRSLISHKLDPARRGPPQTLTEAEVRHVAEPMEETIRLATSELEDLARVLRDAGYCVNLADANATMLFSRLPGEADTEIFLRWKVYTGFMPSAEMRSRTAGSRSAARNACTAGRSLRASASRKS